VSFVGTQLGCSQADRNLSKCENDVCGVINAVFREELSDRIYLSIGASVRNIFTSTRQLGNWKIKLRYEWNLVCRDTYRFRTRRHLTTRGYEENLTHSSQHTQVSLFSTYNICLMVKVSHVRDTPRK
jgi:hypothetical protein